MLKSDDPRIIEGAAYALHGIGPAGRRANSLLAAAANLYSDGNSLTSYEAVRAIESIGINDNTTVLAIIKLLDKDGFIAIAAVDALGTAGPLGKPSLPALRARLASSEPEMQIGIAIAIARITGGDKPVDILTALVNHNDKSIQLNAVLGLKDMGHSAIKSLPPLQIALRDMDESVREAASDAIKSIEAKNK